METIKASQNLLKTGLLLASLAVVSVVSVGARRQDETEPDVANQPTPLIRSVEGPDLFRAYCASCHGLDAKGKGPDAAKFTAKTPDLTVLAVDHSGEFPTQHVRDVILGDVAVTAHGSRTMPIWGPVFHQIEADVDRGSVRLDNLIKYLQSIQAVPAPKTLSAAELYAKDCAVCHGSDLRGGGPAPYPFRAPPNLTTLAQRHGGKFPAVYVSNVLRNGVVLPAHGPAEMPAWGRDFRTADGLDSAQIAQRISDLTSYIKSLQAK